MTSLRKFSLVLIVLAAIAGLMTAPAQAQVTVSCNIPASLTVNVNPGQLDCSATGGTPSYTFSIVNGSLPSGMGSISTGSEFFISGTPSASGSFPFTLQATDSHGVSGSQQFTITVNGGSGGSLSITNSSPTTVTAGTTITLSLSGSGFSSSAIVYVAGSAYSNASFASVSSNQITINNVVIPSTASGSVAVYFTSGGVTSNTLNLSVGSSTGSLTIVCSPNTGPTQLNVSYPQTCSVSGGTGTYNPWGVLSLPNGMNYTSNGASVNIFGTPNTVQTYSYTISVSDNAGHFGSITYSGSIGTPNSGYNITTIAPSSANAGSGAIQMVVSGNGFVQNASQVYFNGVALNTTFVNNVQVNATIPANLLVAAGNYNVQVVTNGNVTNTVTFTVNSSGTPGGGGISITSLSPSSIAAGSGAFLLTIFGSGFTQGNLISFGSCATLSGNVSVAGQISATVPANCVASSQTVNVTVGGSNSMTFIVGSGGSSGALTISCSPSSGPTVVGTFYQQTCQVSGGIPPYSWQISGTLPGGLVQQLASGTGNNTQIVNGTPNLTQTYSYTYNVFDSSTTRQSGTFPVNGSTGSSTYNLTALSQTTVAVNSPAFTLTVYGNGFTTLSSVAFNGGVLPTTYISSTQLYATVPASYLTSNETASITVVTSGTPTNGLTLTVGSGGGSGGGNLSLVCSPGVGPSIVNNTYNSTCTASGGSGSYTWTTTSLPSFVTISGSSGSSVTLAGTPNTAATYNFTVKVTDTSSPAQTQSLQLAGQVVGNSGVILSSVSPTSTPVGNTPVTLTINGSGFSNGAQVVFDGFGVTPTILSASQLSVVIPGNYLTFMRAVQITVISNGVPSNALTFGVGTGGGGVTLSLTCSPGVGPSSPNITYSATCNVGGGNAPYNWSIVSGSLPTGVVLTPNGSSATLYGFTSLNGTYSYTLQVTDSSSPQNTSSVVFAGETGSPGSGSGGLSITSLSPSSTPVSSANTNLTVNGNGFINGAVIYFNGSPLSTTFVNANTLTATIPAASLTQAESVPVTVISGGVTSNAVTFVVGSAPATGITISCNPTTGPSSVGGNYSTTCTAAGGKAPYTWTQQGIAAGSGLALTSSTTNTVSVVGALGSLFSNYNYTIFVSDSSTPAITASYAFVGSIPLSESATITSVSPISVPAGSGGVTLNVTGAGFVPGVTQLLFGGTALITNVNSSTSLSAQVPANLIATQGTVNVQISPGGVSNSVGFFVTNGTGGGGVSPGSFTFTYGIGGTLPSAQTLSITNVGGAVNFNAIPSGLANGVTWLVVTPTSGPIPGSVSVSVAPGSLPIGTYTGSITVNGLSIGSTGSVVVPVTLNVLGAPTIVSSPTSVNLTTSAGGTTSQTVKISSSDGTTVFNFTASSSTNNGGSWLSVSPSSGTTPGTLTVTGAGGNLPPSTYSGTVFLTTSGGLQISIPVSLVVTSPPTVTPNPTSLSFSSVAGQSNPAAQSVSISSSNNVAINYTITATTQSGGNWLSASASSGTTPGSFSVSVNTSGLNAGTYQGTVSISAPGATNPSISVPVTLNLSGPPALTTSPTNLSFSYQIGGSQPAGQTLSINAPANGTLGFNVAAATTTGGSWLSTSPTSGTTPGSVQVVVSTSGLVAGTYSGTLTISASGAASATVNVTLTIASAAPTLSLSPTSLSFSAQVNGSAPPPQTVSVSTTNNVTAPYNVTASSTGNWLTATPSGTTPGTVSVSVNPNGLSVGQYTGSLSISATGGTNNPQTVQVTLNITNTPSISSVPASLSFFVPGDGSAPAPQSITIFSSGTNTSFTAAATSRVGSWLSVSGGGTTPASVMVSVNPTGLIAGQSYDGLITITAPGSTPSSLSVPVNLTVAATGTLPLQAVPSALYLSYPQGAGTDLQHLAVLNNGGGTVNFTAQAASANCGNWITLVTPSGSASASSPAVIAFTVSPTGLSTQTCRGSVTVKDANNNSSTVPVYMAISGQSQAVLLSQTAMSFTAVAGGTAPAPQPFQILNPGSGSMSWNITTQVLSGTSTWLNVAPNTGSSQGLAQAGAPISVSVDPTNLSAGTYYGTVQVTSAGALNTPQSITVAFTVLAAGSNPPETVSPNGVVLNGNNSSDSQTVTLGNLGSNTVTFSSAIITDDGQNWLVATPGSGSINAGGTAAITLTANLNGIAGGLRHGTLRVAFSDGTAQTVDVELVVSGATPATGVRSCTSSNLGMEFLSPQQSFTANVSVPVPLQVVVKDCNGNTLSNSSAGVDVLVGSNDIRLNYTGNGIWSGTWTPNASNPVTVLTARSVAISGVSTASGVITATGSTGPAPNGAAPNVSAVVNAGSFLLPGLVAPGAMVSVFGTGLADSQMQVSSTPFPTALAGAKFTLRGLPLPLFYASDGQVNGIIPTGLASSERDQLIVVRDLTQSAPVDLLVADVDPGIFATNQQGTGQGAILVGGTAQLAAPTGTVPGAAPATAGQVVSLFLSGLGTVSNPPADGSPSVASNPSVTPTNPVVTIGGIQSTVTYSGLAPGEVGLYQVNVQVPTGVPTGSAVPVVVNMGNGISNTVTMAIQ